MKIQTMIADAKKMGRKMRYPEHTFQLRTKPWQIQPFVIAPVLPGETMTNALLQARVVTDPIKNPLVGWHKEYYLFYVKLRDLDVSAQLLPMFVEPNHSTAALNTAAATAFYHNGGAINFTKLCLDRVVDEYFRDEGETVDGFQIANMPAAAVNRTSWLQSAILASAIADREVMPGEDTENENEIAGFDPHYAAWEHLRAAKLMDLTYEDYLKTYGVTGPTVETIVPDNKPELLRYIRDWTYPSNTINPVDGLAASACSWSIVERVDKDRFFKEPGFVFGVTIARPKVYFSRQIASLAHRMGTPFDWLPAILRGQDHTSLRQFAPGADNSPLGANASAAYWVDMKDLFLYGDQFVNYALDNDSSVAALPTTNLNSRYATYADAQALFKISASDNVREDGVCRLTIKGALMDTTP